MADNTIAAHIDAAVAKAHAAVDGIAPEAPASGGAVAEQTAKAEAPKAEVTAPVSEAAPAKSDKQRGEDGKFVKADSTPKPIKFSDGSEYTVTQLEAIAAGQKASDVLKAKLDEQSSQVRSMYAEAQKLAEQSKAERAAAERERQAVMEALRRQEENGGPLDIRDHLRAALPKQPDGEVELTEEELDRRVEHRVQSILKQQSHKSREQYLNENFDEWVKTKVESDPHLKPRAEQYGWYVTGQIRKALAERGMSAHDMRDSDLKALIHGAVAEASAREEKLRAMDVGSTLDQHANGMKPLAAIPTNAGTALPQMPNGMKFDVKRTFSESRNLSEAFDRMAEQVKTQFDEYDRLSKNA